MAAAPLADNPSPPHGRPASNRYRFLAGTAAGLAGLGATGWLVYLAVDDFRQFFGRRAGFDVAESLIPFTRDDTIGRAFVVGILNTVLVAVIGIVLATLIGIAIAIARLSGNWLLARLATVYVEALRNIPLLLFLLFWYRAVLSVLPPPRAGLALPLGANLSNRGLIVPRPIFGDGFEVVLAAIVAAVIATVGVTFWAKRRRIETGAYFPALAVNALLLAILPAVAFVASGTSLTFDVPVLEGFNFVGGAALRPEFVALVVGLSAYTASFIAEIVRAGVLGVAPGQNEAALALGLRRSQALRHVVLPQAFRIVLPPLAGQYLNLTKNSTLAVAIGYPDFVAIFTGSVMQRTSQAVEIVAITMGFYLLLSLLTSAAMNWFNRRVALVER
ncbi:MAG: ABC transporter permease subunit [Bauldia sp.]